LSLIFICYVGSVVYLAHTVGHFLSAILSHGTYPNSANCLHWTFCKGYVCNFDISLQLHWQCPCVIVWSCLMY